MSRALLLRGSSVCALVAILAVSHVRTRPLPFDTQRWIDAGPRVSIADVNDRWRMLDDLRRRHQLRGLTYGAVCELLGPDDGGNCNRFDYSRAGVRVTSIASEPGQPPAIVDPGIGPACGVREPISGRYSTFGGLAPHFMYKIRESWLLRLAGYKCTYLVLIFCRDGRVDDWILERGD